MTDKQLWHWYLKSLLELLAHRVVSPSTPFCNIMADENDAISV